MELEWDEVKRQKTLEMRGLDFADAPIVFNSALANIEDERQEYGESRIITVGYLRERMVVIVWTQRNNARRIISLRKANEREIKYYKNEF